MSTAIPLEIPNKTQAKAELMIAIRDHLDEQKISVEAAAETCGVSQKKISNLLAGKSDKLSVGKLMDLADALHITYTLKTEKPAAQLAA